MKPHMHKARPSRLPKRASPKKKIKDPTDPSNRTDPTDLKKP
jgi:hypothetical protein